jgi:hypothetical protein
MTTINSVQPDPIPDVVKAFFMEGDTSIATVRELLMEIWDRSVDAQTASRRTGEAIVMDVCELESGGLWGETNPLFAAAHGFARGQQWIKSASDVQVAGIQSLVKHDDWMRMLASSTRPYCVLSSYIAGNGHGDPFTESEAMEGWGFLASVGEYSTSLFWLLGLVEAARIDLLKRQFL